MRCRINKKEKQIDKRTWKKKPLKDNPIISSF